MVNLIGYVKGVEISFDFYPPNTYKGIIPKQVDGRYIVELRAIDEAGNISGTTDTFILIDFDKLEYKVIEESYKSILEDDKYSKEEIALFTDHSDRKKYEYDVLRRTYEVKEVVI